MTTAARPTWAPAKGGHEQGGTRIFGPSQKFSSRDLAAHTNLKTRKDGQDTQEELRKRNLREELEEREHRHFSSKDKGHGNDRDHRKGLSAGNLYLEGAKREPEDRLAPRNIDADDSDVDVKSDSDESDDDDDDKDETAALLAELERIRNERAEEKKRKDRQRQEEELKAKEAELIRGNPLLNATSFNVKRRWDDDVVFKNQTRGEAKVPKRFINDTIRNDFHRKFLHKYMK
uniref:TSA: Wollemia nobilis Ref_Wollemi_Transcript_28868_1238 transcribed RNA sequence n=1 Tax=Wollemia nobilis TaxID=56998 RepID=A0A0C9S0T5_9CONI